MSESTFAEVDVSAVHSVADRLGTAAELIDGAAGEHLARLAFGGGCAGRAYAARGDALRAALQRLAAEVTQWARVSADIAAALRASAEGYADAELYAARRIA